MPRSVYLALVLGLVPACGMSMPRTEADLDTCSNGRDDDGDTLVDCADPACRVFAFCASDAGLPDAGVDAALDAPAPEGGVDAFVCTAPLDVVLVLDVSRTMDAELTALRDAAVPLFDTARRLDPSAQVSLTVFVDDVLLVNACAGFGSGGDLATAIEGYRVSAAMNRNVADPMLVNRDCPENSLDALFEAARVCTMRPGSTRVFLHATDDTFVERPGVLSGEWGGGVFVASTYAEVLTALTSRNIHLGALARSGAGEACGAGTSPDTGRGFFSDYDGQPSLVEATSGTAWDVRMLGGGLDLSRELPSYLVRVHPCD